MTKAYLNNLHWTYSLQCEDAGKHEHNKFLWFWNNILIAVDSISPGNVNIKLSQTLYVNLLWTKNPAPPWDAV